MGVVITKYEDSANNNIVFDSSKFDYGYDSDTFPSDAATDFDNIILEHGDVYYITRDADTVDGMGRVTSISESALRIHGMFQDITIKDRKIHEMGIAVPGDRKFYFKPSYTITSGGVDTTHELKEGDFITDTKLYTGEGNTGQWRVVKIIRQWYEPGTEIYRVAIMRNINLDGTA